MIMVMIGSDAPLPVPHNNNDWDDDFSLGDSIPRPVHNNPSMEVWYHGDLELF